LSACFLHRDVKSFICPQGLAVDPGSYTCCPTQESEQLPLRADFEHTIQLREFEHTPNTVGGIRQFELDMPGVGPSLQIQQHTQAACVYRIDVRQIEHECAGVFQRTNRPLQSSITSDDPPFTMENNNVSEILNIYCQHQQSPWLLAE